MAIDPANTDAVAIPQLPALTLALESFLVGANTDGKMGNFTSQQLAVLIAPFISSLGASPFVENSGSPLPNPIDKNTAITFVGAGTFDQTTGSDIVTTEELNVLFWTSNGVTGTWTIGVEVPIDLTGYATVEQIEDIENKSFIQDITFAPADALSTFTSELVSAGFSTAWNTIKTTGSGTIKEISFWCTRAGAVHIAVIGQNPDLKVYLSKELIFTAVLGLNTFIAGTDFDEFSYSTDGYVGVITNNSYGAVGFKAAAAGSAARVFVALTSTPIVISGTTSSQWGISVLTRNDSIEAKADLALSESLANSEDINMYVRPETAEVIGTATPQNFTTNNVGASTRLLPLTTELTDGYISGINFWATRFGNLKFKVFTKNVDDTFNLVQEFIVNVSAGLNNLTDLDYGTVPFNVGNYLGWYVEDEQSYIGYTVTPATFRTFAGDATGNNITFTTSTTVNFGINFTVDNGKLNNNVIELNQDITGIGVKRSNARKNLIPVGNIVNVSFFNASLPTDIIQVGGFIPTTTGLQSPASGGWTTYAYWNKLIVLDEDMVTAKFIVNGTTSIFSVARMSSQGNGTVAEVNLTTGKLNLHSVLTGLGATPASIVASKTIPLTIVSGREYHVTLEKISEVYICTFEDAVTNEKVVLKHSSTMFATSCGKCWNSPGIIFRSGDVKLLNLDYSSKLPKNPAVLICGDSIVDCDTIRLLVNGGPTKRWAGLMSTDLNYNVSIVARPGETTTEFNSKLALVSSLFTPRKAVYALGINDTVLATWQSNYDAFKAAFVAKGSEVIPITLYPRVGRETFCGAVTNTVLAGPERFIDYNLAMTVDGNRVDRNDSLMQADLLHPTVAGQAKLYEQAKSNLPDLVI